MKIGYLGAGAWGFCLAVLLAKKGFSVKLWTEDQQLADSLMNGDSHPKFKIPYSINEHLIVSTDFEYVVSDVDILIESVTSKGVRCVLNKLKVSNSNHIPLVLTSKGIEQGTGLLMSEVAVDVFGDSSQSLFACLSGPSLAHEVMGELPTSVVASSYDQSLMMKVCDLFTTGYFRVYPNKDMRGVCYGGAVKNIVAIACGIADGLGYGDNTKAALMTRGLHEIRKLGEVLGCGLETMNGLSGLGDLCATCLSTRSRNYIFGNLLAKGMSIEEARREIGMVVEGAYTCLSTLELATSNRIAMPITEAIHSIIYEQGSPKDAVAALLNRAVKPEHL